MDELNFLRLVDFT